MIHNNPAPDFYHIDSFVQAATQVIEMMSGETNISKQAPFFNHEPLTDYEVLIFISVTGDIMGDVFAGMKEETAFALAGVLLQSEVNALDFMARSAISEFINVIIGNATMLLADAGYNCLISPPSILTLSGRVPIELMGIETTLAVPIESKFGNVDINISLQKKQ